jgi:Tol biopolymer transport system component
MAVYGRLLTTRRQLLLTGIGTIPLLHGTEKGASFDSDWRRYADPATELDVYRLTEPTYTSRLTEYYNRGIARRNNFLLFSCDRGGSLQAFRMDLKTGDTLQLTDAAALDPSSLALHPDGHSAVYFDGRELKALHLANHRDRTVYTVPDGSERCRGMSLTPDGSSVLLAERLEGSANTGRSRLRSIGIARPGSATVVEAPFEIQHPIARPGRPQVLYRQSGEVLWLVNSDGTHNRALKLAPGTIGPANWSPDGRTLLYLLFSADPARLNEIREYAPETNADKLVAKTSQFVHFGFNRDTSVFVGASRNAGSPTVLLLLRVTRREFTLCEHRSSTPATVAPVFSPDAQRIYFQSDRHGNPAIYCVHVEKLVEKIEAES